MALQMVAGGALARVQERKQASTGLEEEDRQDLRFAFCEYESACGLRSSCGDFEAQCTGVSGGFARDPELDMVERIDRLTVGQRESPASRVRRVRRALAAMQRRCQGSLTVVLWRLYGPFEPPALGEEIRKTVGRDVELRGILALTDVAEAAREELALLRGETMQASSGRRYDAATEERRAQVHDAFWHAAGKWTRLLPRARTPDLLARAAAWRDVMARAIEAYRYDGAASVQCSAAFAADRQTSAEAAIRWQLDYHGRVEGTGKPNADALRAHVARRAVFVADMVQSARALRLEAAKAYREAKAS